MRVVELVALEKTNSMNKKREASCTWGQLEKARLGNEDTIDIHPASLKSQTICWHKLSHMNNFAGLRDRDIFSEVA